MFYRLLIRLLRNASRRVTADDFPHAAVRSILVVELTRLGDVVTMMPALSSLLDTFRYARITVVVNEQYRSLVGALEPRVGVIGVKRSHTFIGFLRILRAVRRLGVDAAISMSPARRNAALTLAGGARCKAGYLVDADSLTPFLNSFPVEAFGFRSAGTIRFGSEHISKRPFKVLTLIGIDSSPGTPPQRHYFPQEDSRNLLQRFPSLRKPFIVFHPFSGWEFRTWSMRNFVELAQNLTSRLGRDVLFLGGVDDAARLEAARGQLKDNERVHFLASADLAMSAALLQCSELFVGNDSGPLHLASFLGIPCVGLFGPAPPSLTAPLSDHAEFLYTRLECSPCDQRICIRPSNPCMAMITPDQVFAKIEGLLSAGHRAGAVAHA